MLLRDRIFAFFILSLFFMSGLSAQTRPATMGGSPLGQESSLFLQVEYARKSLKKMLAHYSMSLVSNSISIDSEYDYQALAFPRFRRGIKDEIIGFKHIPRTLFFSTQDNSGEIYSGKIYLIEQLLSPQEIYTRNSSGERFPGARGGRGIVFSLSKKAYDTRYFSIDLSLRDLNLERGARWREGATSEDLLSYFRDIINQSLIGSGKKLALASLDLSPYISRRYRYNFKGYSVGSVYFMTMDKKSGHLYLIDKALESDLDSNSSLTQIRGREYFLSSGDLPEYYSIDLDYLHLNLN